MNFYVPSHFRKESARTASFFREEVIAVSGVGWLVLVNLLSLRVFQSKRVDEWMVSRMHLVSRV